MLLRQIFEPKLAQNAYLIGCQRSGEALIIDPLRDVDRYLELAREEGLTITAVAETHIHADFLSGARELAEKAEVMLYLSAEGGDDWRYLWAEQGSYRTTFLHDGDDFRIGQIEIRAVHTPGHTPEHMSFLITDHGGGASEPIGIATGDFVFVGDLGRPDLLESAAGEAGQMDPSARTLYRSVSRFLELPDFVQVWPGHGAGSACGKALGAVPSSTVGYEKRFNAALDATNGGEDHFVDSILSDQPEPPLYFAAMKRLNKEGPALLGSLPTPRPMGAAELADALDRRDLVLVDTRLDRQAFMAAHVEGSLYAPFDRSFQAIVGSYVPSGPSDPTHEIVLVIDEEQIDEAIRDLVRIGFDRVGAFITPETLQQSPLAERLRSTPVSDFEGLRQAGGDGFVLDVRRAAEFGAGHLDGALNISHTRLLDRLEEVPRDRDLFVHCVTGARASAATALLEKNGYRATLIDDVFGR